MSRQCRGEVPRLLQKRSPPLLVAASLITLCAATADAHRAPLPLAIWSDNFTAEQARCQRLIGYVAARCAMRAWTARDACLQAQTTGGNCDQQATSDAIAQAHADALNAVDSGCAPDDISALGFLLNLEAETDIDSACNALETAFASAVYGPALRAQSIVATAGSAVPSCLDVTAHAASKILAVALRLRRQTLNSIAFNHPLASQKLARMRRSTARISTVQSILQGEIQTSCSATDFTALYQRPINILMTDIAAQVDCVGGASYVQDAVVCPRPVCGNGIQETGEQCDDGNTVSGDGCSGTCVNETSATTQ